MKLSEIPQLLLSELSDREQMLWQLLREREEFIQELKDEIARLKGEKADIQQVYVEKNNFKTPG